MGRKSYGNPAHRVAKDSVEKLRQDLQHAHKEVVAALEWAGRGEPGQFMEQALDRANLAARFLLAALAANDRELPVVDVDD